MRSAHIVLAIGGLLLSACASQPKPLYMWEGFPRQQYEVLRRDGGSPADQILAMQAHSAKASGAGAQLPPGFRAHLGMLQLAVGNANEARRLWLEEELAFPESTPYIDQLLKRLDGQGTEAAADQKKEPA